MGRRSWVHDAFGRSHNPAVIAFLTRHRLLSTVLGALAGAALLWTDGAVSQGAPDAAGTLAGGVMGALVMYLILRERARLRQ